jgi:hypothetical protein
VVKAHPDDIRGVGLGAPSVASVLVDHHAQHPPSETHATLPVYGSRRFNTLYGRPGGRRQR